VSIDILGITTALAVIMTIPTVMLTRT